MSRERADFSTAIVVDRSPSEVFEAVVNVRGWWSEGIVGPTGQLDDEFLFEVEGIHRTTQRLVEVVPDQRVVWLVTDACMTFLEDEREWVGTRVIFDISEKDGRTELAFTHEGLAPGVECFDACAPAWKQYVQNSLFSLITTGVGNPNLEGRTVEVSTL
jgi:hypothetical protein